MENNSPNIGSIFESFKGTNVVIIGDAMLDRYVYCKTEKMSAEAPIPVWEVDTKEDRLGGAANVAYNIRKLGGNPFLLSVVGDDDDGHQFIQLLRKYKISPSGICLDQDRKTTVKTRGFAQKRQIFRYDSESRNYLDEKTELSLLNMFFDSLEDFKPKVIIIQDYNKGVMSRKVIANIIHYAKAKKIPVAVDPKFKNFIEYQGCTLFKPNLKETGSYFKADFSKSPVTDLVKAANGIQAALECKYTLITLSDKGMILVGDEEPVVLPAYERNICDVSGAGDTVISIIGLGLALGLDMTATAELANIGGGLVCERPGVHPIDVKELVNETNKIFREEFEQVEKERLAEERLEEEKSEREYQQRIALEQEALREQELAASSSTITEPKPLAESESNEAELNKSNDSNESNLDAEIETVVESIPVGEEVINSDIHSELAPEFTEINAEMNSGLTSEMNSELTSEIITNPENSLISPDENLPFQHIDKIDKQIEEILPDESNSSDDPEIV